MEEIKESKQSKSRLIQEVNEENLDKINEQKYKYIYLYGIIDNRDITLDINGLKNRAIKRINFNDISALISFYPTLTPELKEDETIMHADILKKIAEKTTVIPTSFGTVFINIKNLENILVVSYEAIKETLKLIDNKIELGVKIIKNQLEENNNGIAKEILESLNEFSVKSVKGDIFSDRLLLNHSFLVEKESFPAFSDKIASLESKHRELKFIYTGPWPAFSFVNINITGS